MSKEIIERLTSGNICYFSIHKLLRATLLSIKSKTLLYTTYLRPIIVTTIITYACETWSTAKVVDKKQVIFERKVLKKSC